MRCTRPPPWWTTQPGRLPPVGQRHQHDKHVLGQERITGAERLYRWQRLNGCALRHSKTRAHACGRHVAKQLTEQCQWHNNDARTCLRRACRKQHAGTRGAQRHKHTNWSAPAAPNHAHKTGRRPWRARLTYRQTNAPTRAKHVTQQVAGCHCITNKPRAHTRATKKPQLTSAFHCNLACTTANARAWDPCCLSSAVWTAAIVWLTVYSPRRARPRGQPRGRLQLFYRQPYYQPSSRLHGLLPRALPA